MPQSFKSETPDSQVMHHRSSNITAPCTPPIRTYGILLIWPSNLLCSQGDLAVPIEPLQGMLDICRAAQQHSSDMAADNYFSHTGSDGSGLEDRAADNGFYTFPLGENIAAGFASIQTVVLAWMW